MGACSSSKVSSLEGADERTILAHFFATTGGKAERDTWAHKDAWDTPKPLAEWVGVRAVDDRVTCLELPNNRLRGECAVMSTKWKKYMADSLLHSILQRRCSSG